MKEVEIYTDGACRGNPGPGGYGVILRYGKAERELSGGEELTTNRMELLAAIQGLSALKEPCAVTLYSDSKYLVDAINEGWAENWKRSGFRGGKIKNPDLWEKLFSLLSLHRVSFVWVRGHDGHPENERCDKLATEEADRRRPITEKSEQGENHEH